MISFAAGLPPGRRDPAPPTPGMAGISDLKRSDGGWSVISFVPILYSNRSELTTTRQKSNQTSENEDELSQVTLIPRIYNLFRINTYDGSRKCCKKRSYRIAKSLILGVLWLTSHGSEPRNLLRRRARSLSFTVPKSPISDCAWPSTSVLRKIEPILYPEFYCSLDPSRIHSLFH